MHGDSSKRRTQLTDDRLARIRIVLVEPSHPGNIGGAARAMKTMGLHRLAVVNPQRFPDPQAEWRAAGAVDVLDAVEVFGSVDEAIAECHWVVGTSTRSRRIPWPLKAADAVAADILGQPDESRIAILFGRETSGLSNDELQRCHCHLQIPANPAYPSLNLAMAVQVVCYELFKQSGQAPRAQVEWDQPMATMAQLEAFFEHLQGVLIASGFLDPGNPGQTMTRLRRLFTRVQPDDKEIQMLRGVLHQLATRAPTATTGSTATTGTGAAPHNPSDPGQ
jgi:tRNA (cytidine32/uridine32-2'-O)-methyltransferase